MSSQTLPNLIIGKMFVIRFYSYRSLPNVMHNPLTFWKYLIPLSWLCKSWRSVALQYMLRGYKIGAKQPMIRKEQLIWPRNLVLPVLPIVSLVKVIHVKVEFPMADVSANQFSVSGGSYGSAFSLVVYVGHFPERSLDKESTQTNITRLTHFLQEMAPKVKDVEIIDEYGHGGISDTNHKEL